MPETRRSSTSKKDEDAPKDESKRSGRRSVGLLKDETTDNAKKILKSIVQLNETVPASQPDDSPTVTNIKERAKRRSSRRSSGIRALAQTPRALLQNFFDNAEEESPIVVNTTGEVSTQLDAILAPIPPKISKLIDDDDDQDESIFSGSETEQVVRKMPRIRHRAVLEKFSENLKQQSKSPSDDLGSEIKQQQPSRVKKIRNKITAQDIASGIKLSQEKAAEIQKSHNVAEATKTELSLGYLSVNTLNAEHLDDTAAAAVAETSEITDFIFKGEVEEKDDSVSSSTSEKSSKRKRSIVKEGSSSKGSTDVLDEEEEEILQKAKMLRLRADTTEFAVESDGSAAAVFLSEDELIIDVACNVEITETVEDEEAERVKDGAEAVKETVTVKEGAEAVKETVTVKEGAVTVKKGAETIQEREAEVVKESLLAKEGTEAVQKAEMVKEGAETIQEREAEVVKEGTEAVQKAEMVKDGAEAIHEAETVKVPITEAVQEAEAIQEPETVKMRVEAVQETEKMQEGAEAMQEAEMVEEGAEAMEEAETVEEPGNQEESVSLENRGEMIIQSFVKQVAEKSATMGEDTMISKFREINEMLQEEESIDTAKTPNTKISAGKIKEAIPYTSETKRTNSPSVAGDESSKPADLSNSQTVSKTSKVIPSMSGIDMETGDDSTNLTSENVKSRLESVSAVSSSPRGDDFRGSKYSKESLSENIDSSYIEASTRTTELKGFSTSRRQKPLIVSRMDEGETFASGEPLTSEIDMETPGVISNLGVVSEGDYAAMSQESSFIVSQADDPLQSHATIAEEGDDPQSEVTPMLTDEKEKRKGQGSLAGERASTDELFPSSPKETTSSGHSRSSTPASSEADKATRHLTLPSSKSAFVEMKPSRSNLPTLLASDVSTRRISSARRSSHRKKSSGKQENKSYRVIDSIASPTEVGTLHMTTKDIQILPKSPYGTMRSLKNPADRTASPEPQAGPSQNARATTKKSNIKNKFTEFLKKYTIPPKVTKLFLNHYSGLKIPLSCLPQLGKISDLFFDNLFDALQSYANHANRKKIDISDVELYFKRVGFATKNKSLKTLIREYLPLEDQQLLIPVARAGNVVTGGLAAINKTKRI